MISGIKIIFSFASCLFIFSLAHGQTNYPKPAGHVNDFANIIDQATERQLESKLRDYREKTSIEIAVVTVNSLEGNDVQVYAVELAQNWGVGDKAKDNGVVMLIAPNEREMFIATGYGIEPDLTDAQTGRIIRNAIIPHFKSGNMVEGIIAGVDAIIGGLGNAPLEARLEERRITEANRQVEAKRRSEEDRVILLYMGSVLAVLVLIGTPIFFVYGKMKKIKELKEKFEENKKILQKAEEMINKAEATPDLHKNLEELIRLTPKEVWESIVARSYNLPSEIKLAKSNLKTLEDSNKSNGWEKSDVISGDILRFFNAVTVIANLNQTIRSTINQFNLTREQSPKLLQLTQNSIATARKNLAHRDISDKARGYLDQASAKCAEAKTCMNSSGLLNWIAIHELITAAAALVSRAELTARKDKEAAEEARRPKPVYVPSSTHRPSGIGGGRGGFKGFGGGSFGGGGARGKW